MENINNLDVLDVRDAISGIAEMLDIITETLIMLLLDGLEGLGSRWTLICALEVPDEHGTQLVPGVNGPFGKLMSHDLVAPDNAVGKKLIFTRSSPPTASMMV
jgi:hypothetical protein